MTYKVGFIGGGNMASALIGGLLAKGWPTERLWVADPDLRTIERHQLQSIQTTQSNSELVDAVDVVVLAVKPQVAAEVLKPLADQLHSCQPLILSVAAGISTSLLKKWSSAERVIRAMPNTPALVQCGASAYYAATGLDETSLAQGHEILSAVGLALPVEREDQIDAVTALSGSGPAYFFFLMEAMQAAALRLGLSEESARALTLQTASGAAKIAQSSDVHVTELRRRVTSPGGTTAAAISVFEKAQLSRIVDEAMQAAYRRSQSLGNGNQGDHRS